MGSKVMLEGILTKERIDDLYVQKKLSPNEITRILRKEGIAVSSESIRTYLQKQGYEPRDRTEAITLALRHKREEKKYGTSNI